PRCLPVFVAGGRHLDVPHTDRQPIRGRFRTGPSKHRGLAALVGRARCRRALGSHHNVEAGYLWGRETEVGPACRAGPAAAGRQGPARQGGTYHRERTMRIGVFGGTFDPVHLGHLIVAEQCREQGQLDEVLFIPAARPPHKLDRPLTPFTQRVEMLQLTLAGNPAFRRDEVDKNRPGPSYTVDTLEDLHRRDPGAELFLIIGADCLPDLPTWREPSRIAERAGFLVVPRPDT